MNTSDKPFLPHLESFLDCTGEMREFKLTQGPQTDGVMVYALETAPENTPGYAFEVWSATLGDALGRLRSKIKTGLATRHLAEHPDRGLAILADCLSGRIDSGGVTVDGKHVQWDWLVTQLQTYEGWKIEIKIKDASE